MILITDDYIHIHTAKNDLTDSFFTSKDTFISRLFEKEHIKTNFRSLGKTMRRKILRLSAEFFDRYISSCYLAKDPKEILEEKRCKDSHKFIELAYVQKLQCFFQNNTYLINLLSSYPPKLLVLYKTSSSYRLFEFTRKASIPKNSYLLI